MAETQMEKSLQIIITIFRRYGFRLNNMDIITVGNLKQLLEQQTPNFLKENPEAANNLIGQLGEDNDRVVEFEEAIGVIIRVFFS
ncbi:UNVERIFIED_CONTAM: hypothetical protein K2H54_021834 [Gekko kuhli]